MDSEGLIRHVGDVAGMPGLCQTTAPFVFLTDTFTGDFLCGRDTR